MSTMLAYLHPGRVTHNFMHSVVGLFLRHYHYGESDDFELAPLQSGPDLFKSRNQIVRAFLDSHHSHLWFVDSDMGFHPDTLERLLELTTPDAPVVGGLYFGLLETGETDGMGGKYTQPFPHMYRYDLVTDKFQPANGYTTNTLIRVHGTGTGMLMIRRDILELPALTEPFAPYGNLSEDLSFCKRLLDAGVPLHVHTGIHTNHMKALTLTERTLRDFWELTHARNQDQL